MTLSLTLAATLAAAVASAQPAVDLLFVNGRVYTADPAAPWAEAVAVAGERIAAVGSSASLRRMAGPKTRVVDLRGGFLGPGFDDAHVHVDATGALLTGANLLDAHERGRFVERLQAAVARLPEGSWITRGDWGAYEQWAAGSAGQPGTPGAGGAPFLPDRSWVDPVTPRHPVFVNRFDRSVYFANGLALAAAGIDESTEAPPGGEIAKDASGRLTGVLRGSAVDLVRRVVPEISFEQRLAQVRAVLREAREGGVTTLQDLTTAPQLQAYQELRRRGELTARILLRPRLSEVDAVAALGISRGLGDSWLRFIGCKAWVDGIMGSSGAMFFEPYDHDPGNKGYPRHVMFPEGREGAAMGMTARERYTDFGTGNLERLLERAVPTGLPPHVHAIGDKGNRLDRRMQGELLQPPRLEAVDPGIVPDVGAVAAVLAELDVINVRPRSRLEHEDQLVLGPVERAHAAIVLVPDAQVLLLGIEAAGGGQQLIDVPPVHADKVNRAVRAMGDQMAEHGLEEPGELDLGHLAGGHDEVLVPFLAEPGHISGDGNVVGRVGPDHLSEISP